MTPAQLARDLAITAIDLTRACAAHELLSYSISPLDHPDQRIFIPGQAFT